MTIRNWVLRIGLTTVSAVAAMSAVQAADLVQEVPPAPPAVVAQGYGWTGFYLGIGGGAGAIVHKLSSDFGPLIDPPTSTGSASLNGIGGEGIFGEVTAGYDYMMTNRLLIGAFADARIGNIGMKLDVPGVGSATAEADYGFDAGVRLGYLVTPTSLAYVLGGYSWQHFNIDGGDLANFSYKHHSSGFIAGVGLETALRGNWSLKTEYRYAQYASYGFLPYDLLNDEPSSHTFHVALNYRFGGHAQPATFTAPIHNWTGLYVGAGLGAGALVHDLNAPAFGGIDFNGIGGEGVLGEAMIGYDHELNNNFVVGILADVRGSTISTDLKGNYSDGPDYASGSGSIKADYGFDVLGRLGYKVDNSTLAYVVGGYSWQHFKASGNVTYDVNQNTGDIGGSYKWNSSGFTVGGGLETALNERTTVGLEYRYSQYGSEDFGTGGAIKVEPSSHTVRFNLKYKLY